MRLTRKALYSSALPARVLDYLDLEPSFSGRWVLTDEQRAKVLHLLGLKPLPIEMDSEHPDMIEVEDPAPADLMKHQREAIAYLDTMKGRGALFHEMGLGKTRATIEWAKKHELLGRMLVLCPSTVAFSWRNELRKWAGVEASLAIGSTEEKIAAFKQPGPWVMNYEGLLRPEVQLAIAWKGPGKTISTHVKLLVADESTKVKNPTAGQTRVAHKLARLVPYSIVLSGSPVANSPLDLWSQLFMISDAPLGYRSRTAMRARYADIANIDGFNQVVGYHDLGELYTRVDKWCHRRTKKELPNLPPKILMDIPIELGAKEMKEYKRMVKESMAYFDSVAGEPFVKIAPNVLARITRLRQITGGGVYRDNRGAKFEALWENLDIALPNGPVVVWSVYKPEIRAIVAEAQRRKIDVASLDGDTPKKERDRIQEVFPSGKIQLLVGHPETGGYGIQLQRSQHCLYYSQDYSAIRYWQSQDRLHRTGQTGAVTIGHLLAEKTVDRVVLRCVQKKGDVARTVLDDPSTLTGGIRVHD